MQTGQVLLCTFRLCLLAFELPFHCSHRGFKVARVDPGDDVSPLDLIPHIERQGDVAIVVPNGPLDGSKLTVELETDMRKLIYDDQKKIIAKKLDVEQIEDFLNKQNEIKEKSQDAG